MELPVSALYYVQFVLFYACSRDCATFLASLRWKARKAQGWGKKLCYSAMLWSICPCFFLQKKDFLVPSRVKTCEKWNYHQGESTRSVKSKSLFQRCIMYNSFFFTPAARDCATFLAPLRWKAREAPCRNFYFSAWINIKERGDSNGELSLMPLNIKAKILFWVKIRDKRSRKKVIFLVARPQRGGGW